MTQLLRREILLNNKFYVLASREQASKYGYQGRRWQSVRRKVTTSYTERSDVRRGEIPGEWIITWDSFHRGMWGDRDAPPDTYHFCDGLETRIPNRLYTAFQQYTTTVAVATLPMGADPPVVINHKGTIWVMAGRYGLAWASGDYDTTTQDFGAAFVATDAIIHNDELVVGGGTTGYIWVRDNAGSWAQSTDTYVGYFARPENRLWRSNNVNEVSNIGPTDAPETAANWGGTLTVGDDDYNITDLNSMGPRLVISKEEGLFFGDSSAVVPNSLPDVASMPDADNGKQTLVRGNEIFYPFAKGLKYLVVGSAPIADEVGPNQSFFSSAAETQPGMQISAMAAEGEWLYAAGVPAFTPSTVPTGFQITFNSGTSYANETSSVSDNLYNTTAILDSLSTLANGDWFIIGGAAQFYGVLLEMGWPNLNSSALTIQYWNGTAWALLTAQAVVDYTEAGGKTLGRGEALLWDSYPGDWATSTINTVNAYWIRCSVSAALSSRVRVTSCRLLTAAPQSYIYAARKATYGDLTPSRYVWYTLAKVQAPRVTALGITSVIEGQKGRVLVAATRQRMFHIILDQFPTTPSLLNNVDTSRIILSRHDGGMPQMNKEFIDITIWGKTLDAQHTWRPYHRANEATTWTAGTTQTASGRVAFSTRPTGNLLQLAIDLDVGTANDLPAEINKVELRFREMPTYKNEYVALLEVQDNQRLSSGAINLAAKDQITNLEALQGAAAVTVVDPIDRSKTITVAEVQEVEFIQEGVNTPALLTQVRMEEV